MEERWLIVEKAILQEAKNVTQIAPNKIQYEVVLQVLETPGFNGKAYLKECVSDGINRISDTIESGALVSEMDHPITDVVTRILNILWKNVCQRIRSVRISGNQVLGVCENTSNTHGQDLYNLIKHDKLPIGFSLRALGNVRNSNKGYKEVFSGLDIVTWDVVVRPSFSGSVIKRILNPSKFESYKLQENISNFEELLYGQPKSEILVESKQYNDISKLVEKIKNDYLILEPDSLMKYVYKLYKNEIKKKYLFL